ncbi:hypothetical protein CRE_17815 [Caenorhabditis remanei]|uniref:Phospholipase A2 n=1 Tax=Caenorhabditis remanei TaxID=31234 RepID=E3MDH1_CAERE|nr:hypothetical protein CRE_17815 [Caenorhabditis remanei]
MYLVFIVLIGFFLTTAVFPTVIEIEFMTKCVSQHDAWIYNGYGCYCGIGGSGEWINGIDECCAHHDACYDSLYKKSTCWHAPFEYFPIYTWRCLNKTVECTGLDTFGYQIFPHECSSQLCECDRELVECWAKYPMPLEQLHCPHPRLFYFQRNKTLYG